LQSKEIAKSYLNSVVAKFIDIFPLGVIMLAIYNAMQDYTTFILFALPFVFRSCLYNIMHSIEFRRFSFQCVFIYSLL